MAVKCKDCGERFDRDEIAYDGDIKKTQGKYARCLDCHEEYEQVVRENAAMAAAHRKTEGKDSV